MQALPLRLAPGGRLFGVDVDPIELPRTEARLRGLGIDASMPVLRRLNFAELPTLLPDAGGNFDIAPADLGDHASKRDDNSLHALWRSAGSHRSSTTPEGGPNLSVDIK